MSRRLRTALPLAALALLAVGTGPAAAGPGGRSGPPPSVELSASPERVDVVGLPCLPSEVTVSMTNTGTSDVYADATLDVDQPLTLSRSVFSSWLPAADPDVSAGVEVEVRAPRETAPGAYELEVRAGRQRLGVPVEVLPLPPKGATDDLALGELATASSTHGNFSVCGAVDGDNDSEHWSSGTGWNDATRGVFPDTYDVRLAEPTEISRVELYSLDSARYPAARNALKDWDVQVLTGGEWVTVDDVRGNAVGHVTSTFPAVPAEAVRVVALASNDAAYSRIVELEVYRQ